MNITLIGYRGTGKSTVARLLAARLGWTWIDADSLLEERARQTIREIFENEGEEGFRHREAQVIRELTSRDQIVIAAGGGAVLRAENRQAIQQSGLAVWLVAAPETIERRVAMDPDSATRRPALTELELLGEIRRLLVEREPLYRQCAKLIVDTDHQLPDQIADQIAAAIRQLPSPPATE